MCSACVSPTEQMAGLARAAGAEVTQVTGAGHAHLLYRNRADLNADNIDWTLVFIEGDGSPWTDGGTRRAQDPTPRRPIAFNLALSTPLPAWYVTRPCYNNPRLYSECTARDWTDARYSEQIVNSMVRSLTIQIDRLRRRKLVLIGYSGGGTLATLIAARMPQVVGVVSIAANLDTDAWSQLHGYEDLYGSLNPASDLEPLRMPHITLVGDQDSNVPFNTLTRYLETQPDTVVRHFPTFDHVCCWESNWSVILDGSLAQLKAELNARPSVELSQ